MPSFCSVLSQCSLLLPRSNRQSIFLTAAFSPKSLADLDPSTISPQLQPFPRTTDLPSSCTAATALTLRAKNNPLPSSISKRTSSPTFPTIVLATTRINPIFLVSPSASTANISLLPWLRSPIPSAKCQETLATASPSTNLKMVASLPKNSSRSLRVQT